MEKELKLIIPRLRPVNGRIILQLESREKYHKSDSGIILPPSLTKEGKTDNRATENPDDYDYFVVAFAPEVNEQLKMYNSNYIPSYVNEPERTKLSKELGNIRLGDQIMLSEHFETIKYTEGNIVYGIIHWQDMLGIFSPKEKAQNPAKNAEKPKKITLDVFEALPNVSPFMAGTFVDSPEGISISDSGDTLNWVAKKGARNDWAIYCSKETDLEKIMKQGDKIITKESIRKLVDCTDKVFAKYK